jgi:hypothetical protein
MQERGVDHCENRRRRADTQRDRQNYDCRKARRFSQHANAKPQVLKKDVDEIPGDRFTAFFFESFSASELDSRTALSLIAIQPGTLEIIRAALDVCAKLFLHLVLSLRTMEKSRRQRSKISEDHI